MSDLFNQAYCYWPNGSVARDSATGSPALPCDTNSMISSCCMPGQQCNSQFQCFDGNGDVDSATLASCTLENWRSDLCPCPDPLNEQTACADGTICCGLNNGTCCERGDGCFSVIYDYNSALPTQSAAIESYLEGYVATPTVSSVASGSSLSTTTTISPAIPVDTSTSSSKTGDPHTASSSLSASAKLGIAMGITALFALLVAVVIYSMLSRCRVRRKQLANPPNPPQTYHQGWIDQKGFELLGDTNQRAQLQVSQTRCAESEVDPASSVRTELYGWRKELKRSSRVYELDSKSRRPLEME